MIVLSFFFSVYGLVRLIIDVIYLQDNAGKQMLPLSIATDVLNKNYDIAVHCSILNCDTLRQ